MIGRIFLIAIALVSLLWIGYSSLELLEKDKQFTAEYLFGEEDESLLIVNRLSDLHRILPYFETTATVAEIIQEINTEYDGTLYLSANRDQLLLCTPDYLTRSKIKKLFHNSELLRFTSSTTFTLNGFKGKIYRNYCHISKQEITVHPQASNFTFDLNSNGAIVDFSNGISVRDIYLKASGMIEFKTKLNKSLNGRKVNDRDLFGAVISSAVSSYEFYEVDYLRHTDSSFYTGPMNEWVKTGLVAVNYKGSKALITDYLNGQDPLQTLFDHFQMTPETVESKEFPGTVLCKLLHASEGFYVYNMDDFVVISDNAATCEGLIADYKLGNTIVHSDLRRAEIFGQLPQKVNHRIVDESMKQSSSVYHSYLLTTTVGGVSIAIPEDRELPSTSSYAANEPIRDFFPVPSRGIFVLTKNTLLFFNDDAKKWEHPFSGNIIGNAQLIDLFANGNQQLLFTTETHVHLIDVNGDAVNGFPVRLDEHTCVQEPAYYRWKGNGFFIIPLTNGRLMELDTRGRELSIIRTKLTDFATPPVIWASASQPFIGVNDGNTFEMIQAQTKKSFRSFASNELTNHIVLPNELLLVGIHNQQLQFTDQKGNNTHFASIPDGKLMGVHQQGDNPTIIVRSRNTILLFNSKGIEWASIRIPFNEIDRVDAHTLQDGSIVISVIDGLENNVYLYKANGQKIASGKWEGSNKATFVDGRKGSFSLYTIVDKMVVRYNENQ